MTFKVGVTGGIASGKTTVCDLFAGHGVKIIDADIIAREQVQLGSECYQQIVAQFGQSYLLKNGELNRARLRATVFADPGAKCQLEAILHPAIRQQLKQQAAALNTAYAILAIPLLIESGMLDLVDRVMIVDIPEALQLERLCARDTVTTEQAAAMINSQCTRSQRLSVADDVIDNTHCFADLTEKVLYFHHFYRQKALEK